MDLAPGSREAVVFKRGHGLKIRTAFSLLMISVVLFSVLAVTLMTYFQTRKLARDEIRSRLLAAAGTVALSIDAERHLRIPNEKRQWSQEFWDLQIKLKRFQKVIPDVRYVYTLVLNKKNQMVFVGDSDDTQFKSELGEVYTQETPAMREAFTTTAASIAEREFGTDRWGTWLSAYAPIRRKNGTIVGIVGVDIAAREVIALEKRFLFVGIISALFITVILLPGLLYVTHAITKPLRVVTASLRRLSEFDLNAEVSVASRLKEVNELNSALETTRVGLRSFKKYIPSNVATEVISSRVEAQTGGKKREISILFTDFEGFTTFSETCAPDALVQLLNKYFEAIGRIVDEHNGTIDKFIGDSVMAFWNAPTDVPNHPEQACLAALKIVERVRAINQERERTGQVGLNVRVGVNTGIAMVGNIGHEGRLNYTALGDAVNMASRLEALNKKYGTNIMISASTAERLDRRFDVKPIEDVVLKGKSKSTRVFELRSGVMDADSWGT